MLTRMKNILSASLQTEFEISQADIMACLESPKDPANGDLAFPCFALAKKLKRAPPHIAAEFAKKIQLPKGFKSISASGGYLNFYFDELFWSHVVIDEIQKQGDHIGSQTFGTGQTVVIDYSSPNVAKPMSIGHLRSTVIGQALANIHKAMGFNTIGINYLGDWGVQFGKLAWAHLNKEDLVKKVTEHKISIQFDSVRFEKLLNDMDNKPETSFDYLYALYVVFHAVSEVDKELEDFGRDYFLKLERRHQKGSAAEDEITRKIEDAWQKFVAISMTEYTRVYKLLNTRHDLVRGESFHEPDLQGVVQELKDKGLLKTSEGAQIVDLAPYDMPPSLITKSDGATLYATRDIAAAKYRHDVLKADKLIYVVGAEQSLHFKQLFKVLELMGYDWSKHCVHVAFGLYRFKDGKMSTRRGNVVFLEDVLDRAIELVKEIIKEKNPDLKNSNEVATAVGTGAVIFNDLMNDRQKNIDFDWDRLLDFNGDTGPYVQYSHVRCCSVLAKWGKAVPKDADLSLLKENLEQALLRSLGHFNDVVLISYNQLRPNWIAQYLLELAKAFGAFYYEHRILEGDIELQKARIALVDSTRIVLRRGLELLGLQIPEAM
jgi:arginyl-tRNA synthetase